VDVQGKKYIYVVRSNASRDHFKKVMSPEYMSNAKGGGIGIIVRKQRRNSSTLGTRITSGTRVIG